MQIAVDFHTHTIASGHYTTDTLTDLAKAANSAGLAYLAVTDHAFGLTNGATDAYFKGLKLVERKKCGVSLLFGAEVNILDGTGAVDLSPATMKELDFTIASQHPGCFENMGERSNKMALVGAMKNPYVNIIGHPDDEKYPLNYHMLTDAAKEYNVFLEVNNASLSPEGYRGAARERYAEMLALCRQKGVAVTFGSDSHGRKHVGDFTYCLQLTEALHFPKELIANYDVNNFFVQVKKHRELTK